MTKFYLFQKGLFTALMVAVLCGCSQDDLVADPVASGSNSETRAASEFHWRCSKCGFLNAGWQSKCSNPDCRNEYSQPHGKLIFSFLDQVATTVKTVISNGGDVNRIELPNGLFPSIAPGPWYESAVALKYFDALKRSSNYMLTPDYAEAVNIAWYRTVRVLYPKYHDANTLERIYDRFILNEGRNLKDFKGQGIKDASKAAIEAFAAYR